MTNSDRSKFWSHIHKTETCWLWRGGHIPNGYGAFKQRGAHRVSYELHYGRPIPRGMYVCHRCDVRDCVNPDHLFLGTSAQNSRDMCRKGRQARGEKVGGAYFTTFTVMWIRLAYSRGWRKTQIARIFGVSRNAIYQIVTGRTWKHVPFPQETAH